jgi:DNA-binding LytR/AlgR family response regulator
MYPESAMENRIKTIIIDDDPDQRTILKYYLNQNPQVTIVSEYDHGQEAYKKISKQNPDVLFIDIDLPGMNGIELARTIKQKLNPPLIVFYTSYPQYAVVGFEEDAVDYLVKPVSKERVDQSLERINNMMKIKKYISNLEYTQYLTYHEGTRSFVTNVDDIIFLTIKNRKIYIYLSEDLKLIRIRSLKKVEKQLEPTKFMRVNRQYIVNLNEIEEVVKDTSNHHWLLMKDDHKTQIRVSGKRMKPLRQLLP